MSAQAKALREDETQNLTPMLQSYLEYQKAWPNYIIFFQVGDFYEVFFENALKVSKALNITLTSRDKNKENPVPMCGVPVQVIDSYLSRLVEQGFSAVVVSQTGETNKGRFLREIERVVTPGITVCLQEDKDTAKGGVLAIAENSSSLALAYCLVEEKKVYLKEESSIKDLLWLASQVEPKELVFNKNSFVNSQNRLLAKKNLEKQLNINAKTVPLDLHSLSEAKEILKNCPTSLSLNSLSPCAKEALYTLVSYISQIVRAPFKIEQIVKWKEKDTVEIDSVTRANLELIKNLQDGSERWTLYSYLNKTITSLGSSLLKKWICAPLAKAEKIQKRLEGVEYLANSFEFLTSVQSALKGISDLYRLSLRLEIKIINPKELSALRDSLNKIKKLEKLLTDKDSSLPFLLKNLKQQLQIPEEVLDKLNKALVDSPPYLLKEGRVFKEGYDKELDDLYNLTTHSKDWFINFEQREKEKTG
ncbi:MAG: hypothetical protein D6780_02720, partial [Candidatus Dadabacteria bacterium]